MNPIITRSAILTAILAVALGTQRAAATDVTTDFNLPTGLFSSSLTGSGSATILGADANYGDLPPVLEQRVNLFGGRRWRVP